MLGDLRFILFNNYSSKMQKLWSNSGWGSGGWQFYILICGIKNGIMRFVCVWRGGGGGGGGWVVSIMKCGSLLCVGVGRGG